MAVLSKILIVDPDERSLDALAYVFAGEGVQIARFSRPEGVAAAVAAGGVDLVVVALKEPPAASLALLEALCGKAPLLAVGDEAFAAAARKSEIAFLPIPGFIKDLIAAGKLVSLSHRPGGDGGIRGELGDYGSLPLLRTLLGLGRAASLRVRRGHRTAELHFADAGLVHAQLAALRDAAAVHRLLLWERGEIEIKFRARPARTGTARAPDAVLAEAERFLRDLSHAAKDLGDLGTVLHPNQAKAGEAPDEVAPILRLIDGRRSLADVIDESPFPAFDTVRLLGHALELDLATRAATTAPVPAAAPTPGAAAPPASATLAPPAAAPTTGAAIATDRRGPDGDRRDSRRIPFGASGEIEVERRAQPSVQTAPSVVIDLGDAPEPASPRAAAAAPTTPGRAAPLAVPAVAAGSPAPSPAAPATGHGKATAQLTSLAATPVAATAAVAQTAAPRPAAAQPVAVATPEPAASRPPGPILLSKPKSSGASGVMEVVGRKSEPRPAVGDHAPAASIQIAVDLLAPPAPAATPRATPADPSAIPLTRRKTGETPARSTPAQGTPPAAARDKRISGDARVGKPSEPFNPLEADFFEREAELYKQEPVERFDDDKPPPRRR